MYWLLGSLVAKWLGGSVAGSLGGKVALDPFGLDF